VTGKAADCRKKLYTKNISLFLRNSEQQTLEMYTEYAQNRGRGAATEASIHVMCYLIRSIIRNY